MMYLKDQPTMDKHIHHYPLYLLLNLGIIFTSCITKESTNEFKLSGTYHGDESSYVIFKYKDSAANPIEDTLEIIDGKFKAKGYINKVSDASLWFEKTSQNPIEIMPVTLFFIEPGELSITVTEGDFKNTKFNGSSVQQEHLAHEKELNDMYIKINTALKDRMSLMNKRQQEEADAIDIAKLDDMENKRITLLDSIKSINLDYSLNHKGSPIGLYYLKRYFKTLETAYVKEIFENYNEDVKNSLFGDQIITLLNSRKSYGTGDKIPPFNAIDIKENLLDLNSLKGKYHLLDFWASWCKHCLQNIPKLKTLHKTYRHLGFDIIGISIDKKEEAWERSIEKENLEGWLHYINNPPKVKDQVQSILNFTSIPQYILLDQNGVILGRYTTNLNDLEAKLEELL